MRDSNVFTIAGDRRLADLWFVAVLAFLAFRRHVVVSSWLAHNGVFETRQFDENVRRDSDHVHAKEEQADARKDQVRALVSHLLVVSLEQ